MFIKLHQFFFFSFMISGTIIAVSANSWFTCWIGLEINLMSLIPLILSELNFKSTESAIKYFITQASASVLLISATVILSLTSFSHLMSNTENLIMMALAIKAGLAPFHMWFPQVIKSLTWFKCILIMTWQKIAPFMLISCFKNKYFLLFLILLSSMAGAWGGLNQLKIKLLLTYSSIAHSAWMLALSSVSLNYWMFYFSIYSLLVVPIIILMKKMKFNEISEIFKSKNSISTKMSISFLILSLGGLPPFLGFYAKMTALNLILYFYPLFISLTLILASLFSLFFYTKMFYTGMAGLSQEINFFNFEKKSLPSILMLSSVFLNLIISLTVLLT